MLAGGRGAVLVSRRYCDRAGDKAKYSGQGERGRGPGIWVVDDAKAVLLVSLKR